MAIIAIIMAVLVPAIGSARETSKRTLCASNMRQMHVMTTEFANQNDGRAPGQNCHFTGVNKLDPDWAGILNDEILNGRGYMPKNQQTSDDLPANAYAIDNGHGYTGAPSRRSLSCPNFKVVDVGFNYAFAMNGDAVGGQSISGSPSPNPWGAFGIPCDPHNHTCQYFSDSTKAGSFLTCVAYSLGAKLTQFRPNQFLIIEGENSWTTPVNFGGVVAYPSASGKVLLGTSASLPAYSGSNADVGMFYYGAGSASFRHPYYRQGNFLCFDGSVLTLTPKSDILSPRRLGLGLN